MDLFFFPEIQLYLGMDSTAKMSSAVVYLKTKSAYLSTMAKQGCLVVIDFGIVSSLGFSTRLFLFSL